MGRHRAEPEGKRRDRRVSKPQSGRPRHRRNPELLGWGLFLTGTSAACLLWAEVPVALAAGLTVLLLTAFLTTWYLSADGSTTAAPAASGAHRTRSDRAPNPSEPSPSEPTPATPEPNSAEESSTLSPAPGTDNKTAAPVPAIPLAPEAVQEFLGLPRPRPATAAGTSRWTRTFGPPETGSLPLQPYVPARRTPVQTADPQGQDRRQRSHSSN